MKVEKILCMNGGVGRNSYAINSLLQKTVITKAMSLLEESVREICHGLDPKCFMIAEMGCSSGPNALLVVSKVIDIVDKACKGLTRQNPEFGVYLNDLPQNDFNTLFNFLPSFYKWVEDETASDSGSCFVSGTPRSFHGRVFPNYFLHFVHSCYALHWLSQVPEGLMSEETVALNKGNICIAKTSPPGVQKAYYNQFKRDFSQFLRSRAREVVPGGCMVLTFLGSIQSTDPHSIHELLGSTLHDMALEGMIEEEILDKFNIPVYSASVEEVRQLVEAEGSFVLNKLETFTVDWSVDKTQNLDKQAQFVAKSIRAVFESLLANAFGEAIIDDLFSRFEMRVQEHLGREKGEYLNILVSMSKRF